MKYIAPSVPQSIGGVIDDAIRLFRASWSRCWYLAIIPGIFGLLVTFAVPIPVATSAKASLAGLLQMYAAMYTPRVAGLYLLLLIITPIFQGAVLAREAAIAEGNESLSATAAIGTGLNRLLWMFVGGILFGIIVGLGLIALVIPGIWLWGRLMLWTPALFVDGQNALDGFGTSWRLTSGNWWRGMVIFTVGIIIALVLSLVFSFAGSIIAGVLVPLGDLDLRGRALAIQAFSVIGHGIYYPLIAAMWIAMYRDFKLRREGGDLESRAAALGSAA